jgi:SET domain-containing protein
MFPTNYLQKNLRNSFLMNYVGEVCDFEEQENRKKNEQGGYIFALVERKDLKLYIDARNYGNLSRFINHSCDANCEFMIV